MAASRQRSRFWPTLVVLLLIAVAGLAVALRQVVRNNDRHTAALEATAAALSTEVAQQQRRIAQLQTPDATSQASPVPQTGSHTYLAAFQIDNYGYVIFMEWTESNGFVRNGRLLTADNYASNATKAYQLGGIDNAGSFGFTAQDAAGTIPFTGKANGDGTLTITGLPWYVFKGFMGGTLTQTLHAATLQAFNAAVTNLAPPR